MISISFCLELLSSSLLRVVSCLVVTLPAPKGGPWSVRPPARVTRIRISPLVRPAFRPCYADSDFPPPRLNPRREFYPCTEGPSFHFGPAPVSSFCFSYDRSPCPTVLPSTFLRTRCLVFRLRHPSDSPLPRPVCCWGVEKVSRTANFRF